MADTHGFELVIQATKNVLVKALQGAWKSAECPDQADNTGRIPEFTDIPAVGDIGGYPIVDGHIQIPQDQLDASLAPELNGVELILGMNAQVEIGNPPVPSARLLDFHVVLHAKAPVGTLPDTQDVGILLKDITRNNVWAILDMGHPLDASLTELLGDYVHTAYENEDIPHVITQSNISFLVATCSTTTQIFDDESNPARQIITAFPDPNTLQISIPIYLRIYAFVPNPIGPITIASPMGIETRIIINAPFEKHPDKYIAKFAEVTDASVTIGTIAGAGTDIAGFSGEAANYVTNKSTLSGIGQDLDALLSAQLKEKGVEFSMSLGNREVKIPPITVIQDTIADLFFNDLTTRKHLALWTPTASNDEFQVNSINVKVHSDSLNIALNNTGAGDADMLTLFVPAGMEFSIAMSKDSLNAKIQKAIEDKGFNNFPVRFKEDDKDVDLNSLNISIVNHAIRMEGTVTVIDAVLGSIDVDASFSTDVGLHWEPNGSLNADGFQKLKHHIIGDPDVDVDEGIAFWIIAIILTVISFGAGGVLVGIITIVVILVVQAIVENIGSDSLVNGVTGAIDGITAWPPKLSNIGRVTAVFHDPVDISTTGLVISGTFNVVSTCESTQVVPATTAKKYTTQAAQSTELKALKTYGLADYSWNAGDGAPVQNTSTVYHTYDLSGIYLAKHRLKVNEYGGATSRHFGLVRVKNVPAVVNAGSDITVNEGEVVTLEAHFEDIEYADTHWSLWNFGDNQPPQKGFIDEVNVKPRANGVSRVQHAWCDNGTYYVTVQIIDQNGGVGTDTKKVTVLNVPPVVVTPKRIYAYPCSPITLIAHFTDPGWCDKHTATWNFGDCSCTRMAVVKETNEAPAAKGTAIASHTYKTCSTYLAECTVTDDDGGIGTSCMAVEVIELKNPHFNEGFTYHLNGKVAHEWNAWSSFLQSDLAAAGRSGGEVFYCEKCFVKDGHSSQRIVLPGGLTAGVYQTIGANKDWEYQFSAWYLLNAGNVIARLGIDPTGGTDPLAASVVWAIGSISEKWSNLLQSVRAQAEQITVFLLAQGDPAKIGECCFDKGELTALQNMICPGNLPEVPGRKKKCIDFIEINLEEKLPTDWKYKGLEFIRLDKSANRMVKNFPPGYLTSLELGRGLFIKASEPLQQIVLEFAYLKFLVVIVTVVDAQGNVIAREQYDLTNGQTKVILEFKNITGLQLTVRGEGALSKICYK